LGGFGSAVAEVVVRNKAVPMKFVGIKDSFGRSGKPDELMAAYHLKAPDIITAVKKVLQRK
jgi:transketolase